MGDFPENLEAFARVLKLFYTQVCCLSFEHFKSIGDKIALKVVIMSQTHQSFVSVSCSSEEH